MIEEVHIWRGSAAQRARRSEAVKATQFGYFDQQLEFPEWEGKSLLDFGGNRGSILLDPDCLIRPLAYYCIDVIKEAIDEGASRFPEAHFVHYDRYNCSFNPDGVRDLPIPDLGRDFDFILAYSVFTHTTFEEMKALVAQLETRLAGGGTMAFTFIDPNWNENLKWRIERANPNARLPSLLDANARWCSLVNGELFIENNGQWSNETDSCMTYHVFYTEDFMREQFPRAIIRPPVRGEMQHCCVIHK